MNNVFADTNLFLRILIPDDPKQTKAALRVFKEAADGKFVLHTNSLVIAEIIWVLQSIYKAKRATIHEGVLGILNTPGVKVEHEAIITKAMDIYLHTNIDFIDAYSMSWMQGNNLSIAYTFDRRHFSRVPSITVKVAKLKPTFFICLSLDQISQLFHEHRVGVQRRGTFQTDATFLRCFLRFNVNVKQYFNVI